VRVHVLVVRGNGLAILLSPPRASPARKLLSQCALEGGREVDTRVTSSIQQIAADAYVGRTFSNNSIAGALGEFPSHMRILVACRMRINYAHPPQAARARARRLLEALARDNE